MRAIVLTLVALVVAWAFATAGDSRAAGPELRVTADRGTFKIGERVRLTLEVVTPPATQVELPGPDADFGPFELLDRVLLGPDSLPGGQVRHAAVLTVTAYTMGSATLPPLTALVATSDGVRHTLRSDSLTLGIESVVPEAAADTADLRPLKRPFELPGGHPWWMLWAGLALLAAILATVVILRRRRARKPAIEAFARDSRPPDIIALEALETLRRDRLAAAGKMKEHYIRLADIVRPYLERRFRIPALDLTTGEILEVMAAGGVDGARTAPLAGEALAELGRLLAEADLVKFARLTPPPALAEGAIDRAADFVRRTATRLPEPAGESLASKNLASNSLASNGASIASDVASSSPAVPPSRETR